MYTIVSKLVEISLSYSFLKKTNKQTKVMLASKRSKQHIKTTYRLIKHT